MTSTDPRFTHDPLRCAWMEPGGHTWRPLARYEWDGRHLRVDTERCARCGFRRPLGGFIAAIVRGIALGTIRAEYTLTPDHDGRTKPARLRAGDSPG